LNKTSRDTNVSYSGLIDAAADQIAAIEGRVILLGHSFGGVAATDITLRDPQKIAGLICIATPFSQAAWSAILESYSAQTSEAMRTTESTFLKSPTDQNLSAWFASYGRLYFAGHSIAQGTAMLRAGPSVAHAYLGATKEGASQEHLLEKLRKISIPRILIAGQEDLLFPIDAAEAEAKRGGFEFSRIDNAGHFVVFDQPNKVQTVIAKFISSLTLSVGEK